MAEVSFYHDAALAPSTTYYYRAKAVNSAGTSWASPTQSFTTGSGIGAPTNLIAIPSTDSLAIDLHWVRGNGTDSTAIHYSTTTYPEDTSEGTVGGSTILNSFSIGNLIAGETYYISAFGLSGNLTSVDFATALATVNLVPAVPVMPDPD
ncbi:hypothetical protein LCGC14_2828910, partial [marine sediment metagenome]